MTLYLTHGAKKNVGDYLIHDRARKLWAHIAPEVTVESVKRWEPFEFPEHARALVLCGGPGLTPRMVEGVFPLIKNARDQGIPVSGLALGWQGLPARNPGSFAMTARSVSTLRSIADSGAPISVRDDVTHEIAQQYGIETVRTGCSVWYSVPHLGTGPNIASDPRTVVYTTPAKNENEAESIALMKVLRQRFPNAKLVASFHRGIEKDELTPADQAKPLKRQARAAKKLGFEVRDTAYDLGKIGFYENTDLHVGYRVHAHLDFVSRRVPSLLISEDGRGFGQTATLHGPKAVLWAGSKDLPIKVDRRLEQEAKAGWPSLQRAIDTIEEHYPVMQEVIARQAALIA